MTAIRHFQLIMNSDRTIETPAKRTAWKNKLEWLELQLAEIATNQARLEQVLLGYAMTDDGQTVFERLEQGNLLLTEGA